MGFRVDRILETVDGCVGGECTGKVASCSVTEVGGVCLGRLGSVNLLELLMNPKIE